MQCPTCHSEVRITDYFCFNCGKSLRAKPPSVTIQTQIAIYLASFLLPPMGLIWGIKYLKQEDDKSKLVGIVAIGLTLLSLVIAVVLSINVINSVNQQVDKQMQNFGGF